MGWINSAYSEEASLDMRGFGPNPFAVSPEERERIERERIERQKKNDEDFKRRKEEEERNRYKNEEIVVNGEAFVFPVNKVILFFAGNLSLGYVGEVDIDGEIFPVWKGPKMFDSWGLDPALIRRNSMEAQCSAFVYESLPPEMREIRQKTGKIGYEA